MDHWWVEVLKLMEKVNQVKPSDLEKLVKLSCTLTHGNAHLERGMGMTKRVVDGRSSLSHTSVKAQKTVKQVITRYGGVTKVPITSELLNYVRGASRDYRAQIEKEKEELRKKAKTAAEEAESTAKRKQEEESRKDWHEKKEALECVIKSCKDYISEQEAIRRSATEKALKLTDASAMKTSLLTAKFATEAAEAKAIVLNEKQGELAQLMGKKPRK